MAIKVQKPCKICGKMFTPCTDCENDKIMFRWRKIACSQACAKKYFAKILESRQNNNFSENQKNIESDGNCNIGLEKPDVKRTKRKNDEIKNKEHDQSE